MVRLPNWLGDTLMARPLLHALRRALPAAEIWAIGTAAGALLERERLWNHWVAADAHGGYAADAALPAGGFDAALVLPPSFSSAWRLARRARIRIGFASDLRSWLLTRAVRRPPRGDRHLSEEYRMLGAPLGADAVPLPALAALPAEIEEARARSAPLGAAGAPFVVLGPGAIYGPAKRWPFDRYVALGRDFAARGFTVLVAGGAEDRAIADPMAEAIGPRAHSIAGRTTLGEQLALCAAARVTVCNDSGLAHLSAATGAPTVVIFGSTSSAWTAPLGPRVRVVQDAPVCAPCFRRTCRIGTVCLTAVDVRRVREAADRVAA